MVRIFEGRLVSGWDKSAALLLAISDESRKMIFEHFSESEIRQVSLSITNLGVVEQQIVDSVLKEFQDIFQKGRNIIGGFDETRRMLENTFGIDRARMMLEGVDEGKSGVWEQLSHIKEDLLLKFLKKETPQTIAVILSRILPSQSATILKMLPEEISHDVMMRILKTSSIKKEVLGELQRSLKMEFMEEMDKKGRTPDSHKVLAEIFNAFDRQTEENFMKILEENIPESAERVKSLMFTFNDLIRLDKTSLQIVIREVDKGILALSLKGVSETIKNLFFSNMSERAGKLFKEDMASLGSVRLKDVEDAQAQIITTIKNLEQSGQITISETSEDDNFIV
jgi:flagellar motor switch protein FliG